MTSRELSDATWSICIDFGTANSKAAAAPRGVVDPTHVRPLPIATDAPNPFLAPGILFVDDGVLLFGRRALQRALEVGAQKRDALQSFKTLLGAPDLERSITALAPKRIDPDRQFRQRDLIVLFLAYLTRGIDRAVADDPVLRRLPERAIAYRYARPSWRTDAGAASHRTIARMFDEARGVARLLPDDLDDGAAPTDVALRALEKAAHDTMGHTRIEGAIFEAAAAAACHRTGRSKRSQAMIVLDVGAGTTDVGAIGFASTGAVEITEARRTINTAGDAIDRVLMNAVLSRARHLRTTADQTGVWRDLALEVRAGKERLFAKGEAAFAAGGKVVRLSARDVLSEPDAKDIFASIREAYEDGLQAACQSVASNGGAAITAVAAGGGAGLEIIQNIVRTSKPSRLRVQVDKAPIAPAWVEGPLKASFPMLSIAIGGAMAEPDLLSSWA